MNPTVFICYPKALLTGISLPMEMISAASSIARIKRLKHSGWSCHVATYNRLPVSPIETAKGLHVLPEFHLGDLPKPKTIFLPPMWGNPDSFVENATELKDWLLQQHEDGVQICATGTGVCLLADIGLLDDKIATTHWYYFDEFERKYPKVNLQRHHFITQADNLLCCGSINAAVDLVLYFIEGEYGKEVSEVIERHFNHEINRTYDKPWYSTGASRHPDEGIIEAQEWMQTHPAQNFNLTALSEMANMSVRNFSRRFKAAVGKSVLAYGQEIKMQLARELLKNTNLTQQDIADQVGFKDSAYFSRQFKILNNITPGDYRKMVRAKLFSTKNGKVEQ